MSTDDSADSILSVNNTAIMQNQRALGTKIVPKPEKYAASAILRLPLVARLIVVHVDAQPGKRGQVERLLNRHVQTMNVEGDPRGEHRLQTEKSIGLRYRALSLNGMK